MAIHACDFSASERQASRDRRRNRVFPSPHRLWRHSIHPKQPFSSPGSRFCRVIFRRVRVHQENVKLPLGTWGEV